MGETSTRVRYLPVPNDADDGSDEDEEVCAVHSHAGSSEHRTRCWISICVEAVGLSVTYKPIWYWTPGLAMQMTTRDASNAPRTHETNDCCQVYCLQVSFPRIGASIDE